MQKLNDVMISDLISSVVDKEVSDLHTYHQAVERIHRNSQTDYLYLLVEKTQDAFSKCPPNDYTFSHYSVLSNRDLAFLNKVYDFESSSLLSDKGCYKDAFYTRYTYKFVSKCEEAIKVKNELTRLQKEMESHTKKLKELESNNKHSEEKSTEPPGV